MLLSGCGSGVAASPCLKACRAMAAPCADLLCGARCFDKAGHHGSWHRCIRHLEWPGCQAQAWLDWGRQSRPGRHQLQGQLPPITPDVQQQTARRRSSPLLRQYQYACPESACDPAPLAPKSSSMLETEWKRHCLRQLELRVRPCLIVVCTLLSMFGLSLASPGM